MHKQPVQALLSRFPLVSDQVDKQELAIILECLKRQIETQPVGGSIVEMGCYIGTTSLFVRRLLDAYESTNAFHVYDSFSGLPPKTTQDLSPAGEQFKTGELAVSRKAFEIQFKKANLRTPIIHKAWFSELSASDMPHEITFAYLDGDYYDSIKDSLRLIETRLVRGACIVVDDYANEALPGAAKAVDEWLRSHPATLRVESSLAIIYPKPT